MLPYPTLLRLLRPAATRTTVYRADDGSGELAEVWVTRCGAEWLSESMGGGAVAKLWRPVPLVRACDLTRELNRIAYHGT